MSTRGITSHGLVRATFHHGHWTAHFVGRPEVSFGGNAALVAAKRLVRTVDGLVGSTLRVVGQSENGRRAELTVRPDNRGSVCPECGGTGRYVGLAVAEKCRACGGTGIAVPF